MMLQDARFAWVTVGVWAAFTFVAGGAAAQGPTAAARYEKRASWSETLVSIRAQTVSRSQLFQTQPAAHSRFPVRASRPFIALWSRLERDFPLECDWMLQDMAACGYPCSDPSRPNQYPMRWFGPQAHAGLERTSEKPADQRISTLLTDEQLKRWRELTGEPFKFFPSPAVPPTPTSRGTEGPKHD